jgi:hypothetical protein
METIKSMHSITSLEAFSRSTPKLSSNSIGLLGSENGHSTGEPSQCFPSSNPNSARKILRTGRRYSTGLNFPESSSSTTQSSSRSFINRGFRDGLPMNSPRVDTPRSENVDLKNFAKTRRGCK